MQNTNLNPQLTLNTAMQHMQSNQFSEALQLFKQLENHGMNDHRLFRVMGSAYERLNQLDNASQYLEKSLNLNPKQADLHFAIGNIASAKEQHSSAQASFQNAVNLSPENLAYRQKLALCLLANHNYQKALESFQLITQQEPQNTGALIGASRVYAATGKVPLAQGVLQDSLLINPKQPELVNELAWLFKNLGNTEKAIDWFDKRLALEPQNPDAFEDLALSWLDTGNFQKAIQVVSDGIKVTPLDQKLNKLLATLKYELAYENHLDHYQAFSVKTMPNNLLYDYLQNLLKIGNTLQVQDELDNATSQFKLSQPGRALQLSLWNKQKNFESIITSLQANVGKGITLDNQQLEMLCTAYLAIGEGSKAIAVIKPQLERYPNDQYYWALYTTALRQIGSNLYHKYCNYDDFVFQQPLQLDPNQGNIEEFNHRLKSMLESLHTAKRNPLEQSLIGGTQTVGMLLNRDDQIILDLKKALRRTFESAFAGLKFDPQHPVGRMAKRDYEFSSSWSVKLSSQGFHVSHVHPKGWYSSAYYVDLPPEVSNESEQGWLNLGKPGVFLEKPMEIERWIKPEIGKLVLFPSYFWHGTAPFESDCSRMSVGLDILPK